jgi:D-xylose transport system ATP-binding protein
VYQSDLSQPGERLRSRGRPHPAGPRYVVMLGSNGSASVALLSARGLSKSYGSITALDNVDLELREREILALVGDNGAGKSTLVSILAGVQQPDSGEIHLDGNRVSIESPKRAQDLGIATVFQDLALVNQRDVAANLFLGREPVRFGVLVDRKRMFREAAAVIARLRVELPSVRAMAGDLSGGQRQAVAVARAIMGGSRVLLMDEPTAALGVRESGRVMDLMRELRTAGHTILLVSHNLESVFSLADRIVVLRLGRMIASSEVEKTTKDEIVGLIVGSRFSDR